LAKASAEIKRDIETIINANQAAVAGNGTNTARKMSSLLSFIKTNTSVGAGTTTAGADPTTIGVSARVDADTTRTFTEAMLKEVVREVFASGGTPSVLMVSPALKQTVSGFTGLAATRYQAPVSGQATILAGADIYQSDFGQISIVPNRFMRSRDALLLDPEYAALAYLRPFQTIELAKAGDADKTQILAELTLEVRNEAAHGGVFDLNAA
jgi:predicted secreted protein